MNTSGHVFLRTEESMTKKLIGNVLYINSIWIIIMAFMKWRKEERS